MMKNKDFHEDNKHPKVLVVAHNCFSKTGSNGRTLGNFFDGYPKESLAQFYISNEVPDSEVCDNYFRVTDVEALKSCYKDTKSGRKIKKEIKTDEKQDMALNNLYKRHRKRTSLNYILRNIIWDSSIWKNKEFEKWIDDFNPDIILLQLGDYAFMLRIALKLAKKRGIPLVIYNSEDYYFKDRRSLSPLYHYYRHDYKCEVRKLISYSSQSIYNSEMLQQTYQSEFQHQSTYIMTSTDITQTENKKTNSPLIVSYLGNLGVGRHEPLIEIAEVLHKLSPDVYLDIYGTVPNKEVEKAFRECSGIRIKGFVPYDEVIRIMKCSDLLVHVENFSDYYQWDLKHAFSTKIADSLASGTCLFIYAPNNMAFSQYLMKNDSACVVIEPKNLSVAINKLIDDEKYRQGFVKVALKISDINHNKEINKKKFIDVINNTTLQPRE